MSNYSEKHFLIIRQNYKILRDISLPRNESVTLNFIKTRIL